MVRDTSLEVYQQIRDSGYLSEKRFVVYETLFKHGPLTGAQVADLIKNQDPNVPHSETIRNRLGELRDQGVVKELGTTACPLTGRRVILWDVTGNLPSKKLTKRSSSQKLSDLKSAVVELRSAQKLYMENRGNDEIGQQVAHAAAKLDQVMETL